jgi:peptidoglycan/xylan/chitin deacetylase (PgdA/CDA1 family)
VLLIVALPLIILGFGREAISPNALVKIAPLEEITQPDQKIQDDTNITFVSKKIEYSVPILMYHYIRDIDDPTDQIGINLSVSPRIFESQLKYLSEQGYESITPVQLSSGELPDKPIMITFDDGYDDAYSQAFPILKKYNFTGVFYVITGKVGQPEYANWDQLKEMQKAGMIIGSHTVSHPSLDKATKSQINKELVDSKTKLETELGTKVTDFCYPAGKYNTKVIEELQKIGYTDATTTHSGISNQDSSLFELPRIRVESNTNLEKVLK